MTINYTTLLGLAQPVTGTEANTWGTIVNNSVTALVESSIAGSATAAVTAGDWTLTTTGSGAANQARSAILIPTGTPGVSRNIIAPSSSKAYIVDNQSNAAVVIKGAATTGVSIATNTAALVAWDGADFVLVSQALANATGVLPVAKGGTGITSFGTGVATALGQNVTGSGGMALSTSPTLTTPNLGTPSVATLTNATGLPIVAGTTGTLSVVRGGTGATDAATARTNLGVTATGADTAYAFRANNLSDLASVATARTNLGVTATGADTAYAFRANNLSDLASAATARTNLGVTATGADTAYAFRANNLSDLASVATARTNLGLGTIATQNANAVAVTGGSVNGTTVGASTPSTGTFTDLTVNGNLIVGGSALVDITDIGTDPNQIPLNQFLGTMAYQDLPNVELSLRPIVPLTSPTVQDVIDALLALGLVIQED
jgi:hypothetical protein